MEKVSARQDKALEKAEQDQRNIPMLIRRLTEELQSLKA
jgi:hypothetical protein